MLRKIKAKERKKTLELRFLWMTFSVRNSTLKLYYHSLTKIERDKEEWEAVIPNMVISTTESRQNSKVAENSTTIFLTLISMERLIP